MKKIYFITATNTNIGKTKASEIFIKKYSAKGKKVGYLKPIETGVTNAPQDGFTIFKLVKSLNNDFNNVTLNDIVPYQFHLPASPIVANQKNIDISIEVIKNKITLLHKYCDILIIEGVGGLYVPIKKDYFMIDLIKDIVPTKTFLIVPSHLGCINDTLLSINLLKQYNIKFQWYINLYKDKEEFYKTTLPFYNSYFDKIYFL